jgi:hypothetical protein
VRFESESRLSRIEKYAFFGAGLIEIISPSSVEVLNENCSSDGGSRFSVYLNQSRDYHELKSMHSLALV